MNILINFFPPDIYNLIKYHYYTNIIQNTFKLNRPLTKLNNGDRVCILKNKKIYGTIINLKNNFSDILLLPRLIPFWKKCNINFWLNNKNLLEDSFNVNFPYYCPKIKIKNDKLIKLNDWNFIENSDTKLSGEIRLIKQFDNIEKIKKSNLFNYYY